MPLYQTFLSLVAVLLFEQLRPLPAKRIVLDPLRGLTAMLVKRLDGERKHREQLVWGVLILGGTGLCALVSYLLPSALGVLFAVLVLYLCLGFRHESHYFTDIHIALRSGEIDHARALLSEWKGGRYDEVSAGGIARLTIEQALTGAHRNVFGGMFWFVVLGPCGVVMYRLARFLYSEWNTEPPSGLESGLGVEAAPAQTAYDGMNNQYGEFARHAFLIIDWLPSRMTAILFAIGGNFEESVFCWRAQAMLWPDRASAILVTSGAGALGVRLGVSDSDDEEAAESPEIGVGEKAGVDNLQTTVGLVWRALIVFLILLALTAIAALAGS
ncbi:MAG: cobalamin biosynthesis protein [Azoarcus sp.]|jgi:adenosylcobinamide-phosphate synthase|nr:cobalamin biosynthesis protein [Azoarcus sp.]